MVTLGIDFGTSSTVAVVELGDGRAVPLLFGETPLLLSAVCVTQSGELLVGRDAARASRGRPEAFERHPKSRIDDGEVLLGDLVVPVAELIGAVLRRVHHEAVRVAGVAVDRLVLTHPARWGARRRQTLLEAAAIAGLPPAVLVAEPVAAAAYYANILGHAVPPGRCLVVYDFGAGTFDASVVRRTGGGFEVLAEEGILGAGGLDVDAAIVAHLGAVYGANDPESWGRLTAPAASVDRRLSRTFWDDVRTGKEELSRTSMTTIFVPILELEAVLGREQLDHLARPLLDRTVAATRLALRSAGIRAEQVVAVFLVGGSSRMSLSATLLHRSLGVAPTVIEQPELIVASGTLYIDGAEPANAEPSTQHEERESVPPKASPPTVAELPALPALAPDVPDTSVPVSPVPISSFPISTVPVSPAPISLASTLRHLPVHVGHGQSGEDELGTGGSFQAAAPTRIPEASDPPESAAESIEPPHVDKGQPRTTAEVVAPVVPARRRRRLLAVAASALAIIVVVVVIALQSKPPVTDPTIPASNSCAPTASPSYAPTASPSFAPTASPSSAPTASPSSAPTADSTCG